MRNPVKAAGRLLHVRNGRRRTLLGLIGLIWLLYGWSLFKAGMPTYVFGHQPGPIDELLTSPWSSLLWVWCGLTGIASAALPRKALPDAVGFNALLVPPMLWSTLYGWSWVIWELSGGEWGAPRTWVMAVIWSCAVAVLLITSGWPDPDDQDKQGGAS